LEFVVPPLLLLIPVSHFFLVSLQLLLLSACKLLRRLPLPLLLLVHPALFLLLPLHLGLPLRFGSPRRRLRVVVRPCCRRSECKRHQQSDDENPRQEGGFLHGGNSVSGLA
jgi:hypothetical protein